MIAINIIQYKFRNDLLDDLECSSQQNNCNNYNNSNIDNCDGFNDNSKTSKSWKQTFSVNSLKRTISAASLRRSKKELNKNQNDEIEKHSDLKHNESVEELECESVNEEDEQYNEIENNDYDQDDYELSNERRFISNRRFNSDSFFNEDESSLCKESDGNGIVSAKSQDELNTNNLKKKFNNNKEITISQDKLTNDSGKSSGIDSINVSERMNSPSPGYEQSSQENVNKSPKKRNIFALKKFNKKNKQTAALVI